MRDEARVVTNALLAYGSRGLAVVVGLLMVPYLLGQLGETGYGTIGIANSLLMGIVVIEFGLRPAASRQFTRFLFGGEPERANRLASTAMAIYGGLGVVVLLAAAAASEPFLTAMGLPPELVGETWWVLMAVAGSLALTLLRAPYEAALASQLRYDVMQYCEAGGTVFRAVFIVACFSAAEPALIFWGLAALVWSLFSLAIHAWQAHLHCGSLQLRAGLVSAQGARDLMGLGAWAGVLRVAQWLADSSGALVIGAYLGASSVSYYQPAIVLIVALSPLSRAFLTQLTPVVTRAWAEQRHDTVRSVLIRSTRYSILIGGGAVALVAALAHTIVPIWLGPGFEVTAWVMVAWALRSLLQSGAGGSFAVFMGTGRIGAAALLNSVLGVAGFAGSIYLVRETSLGVLGPALAMLAAQALRSLGWFAFATRFAGVDRLQYLRESFGGTSLSIVGLVTVALGVQYAVDADPLLELLAAAGTSGTVYVGLVWAVGLNAADRAKALGYLRSGWHFAHAALRPRRTTGR